MTSAYFMVIDAPGHHGDWIKVYRVCRTLAAARRFIGRSPQFAIITSHLKRRKGDVIARAVPLTYVPQED